MAVFCLAGRYLRIPIVICRTSVPRSLGFGTCVIATNRVVAENSGWPCFRDHHDDTSPTLHRLVRLPPVQPGELRMQDDSKVGESALLCLLSLMRHSFRELTAKFGAIDASAADRAPFLRSKG